jgi:hypothetical protein
MSSGGSEKTLLRISNRNCSPALSESLLKETSLIGESWCEDEYAELALAWFPSLAPAAQQSILSHIDQMPDKYRAAWAQRVEEQEKQPPNAETIRAFDDAIFREAVWKWRLALPADRKERLDAIVREQGDPDAWHERLFPTEVSPLTGADLASRPIPEIISFLQTWQPQAGPKKQTITALAQQLRQAVDQEPVRFAEQAERFAVLRPIYVRRVENEGVQSIVVEGDDPDWLWASSTAGSMLRYALGQGRDGIPYAYAARVLTLIRTLLRVAPEIPEAKDFDSQFERHTYFNAEQTLRGRAIELCIMYIFWESKQPGSPLHTNQHAALALRPDIQAELDKQLEDRSNNGRVPRAIIGRWMQYCATSL